jgi:hypothetical protein
MKILKILLYSISIIFIAIGICLLFSGEMFMSRFWFYLAFITISLNILIDNIRLRKNLKKKNTEINLLKEVKNSNKK